MERQCVVCRKSYEAKRATARYCSTRCRTAASRAGKPAGGTVVKLRPDAQSEALTLAAATRAALVKVQRDETPEGVAVLLLAQRIDLFGPGDSGSGVAAMVKEHRVALAAALAGANVEESPVDRIRRAAALKIVGLTG